MIAEERIKQLEEQLSQALEQIGILQEQLAVAHRRIEEWEKQKTPPPAFVKANVKKASAGQKKPRKKRNPKYNHGRRRGASHQHVWGMWQLVGRGQRRSSTTSDRDSTAPTRRGHGTCGVSRLV